MLIWRITLGAGMIAALVGVCWLDWRARVPGAWLLPVVVTVALLAAAEMAALAPRSYSRAGSWAVCLATLLVVTLSGVPAIWPSAAAAGTVGNLGWPAVGLAAGLLVLWTWALRQDLPPDQARVDLAFAVLTIVYVGLLLGFLLPLRLVAAGPLGTVALVSLLTTAKMGDIGAYTCGRLVGRHKMAPRLSPGKTWEGAAGAIAFACLGAWLTLGPLPARLGLAPRAAPEWLGYGVAIGAAGLVGDLAESLLKRGARVKDSSGWLPGFGGVLDLLDSLLFAAPVAYLFWSWRVASGP